MLGSPRRDKLVERHRGNIPSHCRALQSSHGQPQAESQQQRRRHQLGRTWLDSDMTPADPHALTARQPISTQRLVSTHRPPRRRLGSVGDQAARGAAMTSWSTRRVRRGGTRGTAFPAEPLARSPQVSARHKRQSRESRNASWQLSTAMCKPSTPSTRLVQVLPAPILFLTSHISLARPAR